MNEYSSHAVLRDGAPLGTTTLSGDSQAEQGTISCLLLRVTMRLAGRIGGACKAEAPHVEMVAEPYRRPPL